MTTPGTTPDASSPFLIRDLDDVPPQPLTEGAGSLKDLWAEAARGQDLRWLLRQVEVRGTAAKMHAPADTAQLIVGLSGPQVSVGVRRGAPLRREKVLTHAPAVVDFHRPLVRVAGASKLLTLSYRPAETSPSFTFETIDGELALDPDVRALIALRGEVEYAGGTVAGKSVLVLPHAADDRLRARGARVLLLRIARD